MNEIDVSEILKNKRLKLGMKETIIHYSPALVLLSIPIINLFYLVLNIIENDKNGYNRVIEGIDLPVLFLLISILFFIIKYNSLKFKTIDIDIDINGFNKALELTIKELEWKTLKKSKNYFSGISESSLIGFGERVTILKKDKLILINSINDPYNVLSNFSFGASRKNLEIFKRNLKASVQ